MGVLIRAMYAFNRPTGPCFCLRTVGRRTFSASGANMWNDLLSDVTLHRRFPFQGRVSRHFISVVHHPDTPGVSIDAVRSRRVSSQIHTADATQLSSRVASAVYIGLQDHNGLAFICRRSVDSLFILRGRHI